MTQASKQRDHCSFLHSDPVGLIPTETYLGLVSRFKGRISKSENSKDRGYAYSYSTLSNSPHLSDPSWWEPQHWFRREHVEHIYIINAKKINLKEHLADWGGATLPPSEESESDRESYGAVHGGDEL